ncbi:MAG TPA: ATP-binding protein, partial [Gemmatimonadaceae bacterium]|nr:ATP-binding protein [Gemmatimonadaceae bacterium]
MTRNPFEFGRELNPDELVDRDAEVAAVATAMRAGAKLFLIGPRRYGKTSILRAASDRAARHKVVVLRYDAEAFPALGDLAARLVADTATRLTSTVEKAGAAIKDLFARVRPQASFDPAEHTWTVSLGGATSERATGVPLLADVLNGVERGALRLNRSVAVVIDEFQKVIEDGGPGAEGQIRSAIQRHSRVAYIFAGS